MEGGTNNVQQVVKHIPKFDGKMTDDFLEGSSKLRVSLSLYSKSVFNIVQSGSRWPSGLARQPLARLRMMQIAICTT